MHDAEADRHHDPMFLAGLSGWENACTPDAVNVNTRCCLLLSLHVFDIKQVLLSGLFDALDGGEYVPDRDRYLQVLEVGARQHPLEFSTELPLPTLAACWYCAAPVAWRWRHKA